MSVWTGGGARLPWDQEGAQETNSSGEAAARPAPPALRSPPCPSQPLGAGVGGASPASCHPVLVPTAVTTHFHQLGDMKQRKFIVSKFWRPEIQTSCQWAESEVLAGPFSVGESAGHAFPASSACRGRALSLRLCRACPPHLHTTSTVPCLLFRLLHAQTLATGVGTALIQDDLASRSFFFFCLFSYKCFSAAPRGLQDLSSPPGIEHKGLCFSLAVKAQSPNRWTTREFPPDA